MSDRLYTSIEVSGPDANAAAKFAMKAILDQPQDGGGWDPHGGCWVDGDERFAPCYFDHNSGQGAVNIITEVSRRFPTETFHLFIDGSCNEGVQGPVRIQNGSVTDGRTEEYACGEPYDSPRYIAATATFKEHPVPEDTVLVRMSAEQLVVYLKREIRGLRERLEDRDDRVHELEKKYLPPIDSQIQIDSQSF
jgi:hypothetical protein